MVLVIVGHYLPGFRAGGITTCVANIVANLHREYRFMVVTRDRDLGNTSAYPGVRYGQWHAVGGALVQYVRAGRHASSDVWRIMAETPHDLVYFNSFFEPLVVRTLMRQRVWRNGRRPALLAPHGEFAWPSLSQKFAKKAIFMRLARGTGLYANLWWHASNAVEAEDIHRWMGVTGTSVRTAHQLPPSSDVALTTADTPSAFRSGMEVRAFFLARVSPEKNLHVALEILRQVSVPVAFDIIGPIENVPYWKRCEELIAQLPAHVTARSVGTIEATDLLPTLARYDVMLFPTGGEGYGQVIAESLITGTQVLISTDTPWRGLQEKGLGWDIDLREVGAFARVVDSIGSMSEEDRSRRRHDVQANMRKFLAESSAVDDLRRLFNDVLAKRT